MKVLDDVSEARVLLLSLTSRFAEGEGAANSGFFFAAVFNGALLGAPSSFQVGSLEELMECLASWNAHRPAEFQVGLPVDGSSRRCSFDVNNHVLDRFRECVAEVVNGLEGNVLGREVHSHHPVA